MPARLPGSSPSPTAGGRNLPPNRPPKLPALRCAGPPPRPPWPPDVSNQGGNRCDWIHPHHGGGGGGNPASAPSCTQSVIFLQAPPHSPRLWLAATLPPLPAPLGCPPPPHCLHPWGAPSPPPTFCSPGVLPAPYCLYPWGASNAPPSLTAPRPLCGERTPPGRSLLAPPESRPRRRGGSGPRPGAPRTQPAEPAAAPHRGPGAPQEAAGAPQETRAGFQGGRGPTGD
ncbi:unnamed protein product [Natator depressus]